MAFKNWIFPILLGFICLLYGYWKFKTYKPFTRDMETPSRPSARLSRFSFWQYGNLSFEKKSKIWETNHKGQALVAIIVGIVLILVGINDSIVR